MNISKQIGAQLWCQLEFKLRHQTRGQLGLQLWWQIRAHLRAQPLIQLEGKLWDDLYQKDSKWAN